MGIEQRIIGGITEYSQKSQYWLYYHVSKLVSSCNLGKDLSKSEDNDQLVKYKYTGLYLQLYINNHEKIERCS